MNESQVLLPTLLEIFTAMLDSIAELGGSERDLAQLETLAPEIAAMVIASRPLGLFPEEELETIEIKLDRSLSLAEQVQRGDYRGRVAEDYKRIKLSGKSGKRTLVLLDPKGDFTIAEMLIWAKVRGLKRPLWDDALAVGYQKPKRQTINTLVFPTEEMVHPYGGDYIPVLANDCMGRALRISSIQNKISKRDRCVFVRE